MQTLQARLDHMPPRSGQVVILLICLLLNMADGFDVLAMSYAAPSLAAQWSVAPAQLGIVFSAALVGMALGSMVLAPFADVVGRRTMVLIAATLVSACMFATALCTRVWQLVALRLLAGVGIGIIVPTSATLATEYAPAQIRNAAVVLIAAGFSIGAVAAGVVGEEIITAFGWQGLFVTGGVITATLALLSALFLKESVYYLAAARMHEADKLGRINKVLSSLRHEPIDALAPSESEVTAGGRLAELFAPKLRLATGQVWLLWFAYFWASYLVANWIPTLMVYNGYTQAQGIDALPYFTTGALIGAIALGFASARFLLPPMVSGMLLIAAVLVTGWVTIDFEFSVQKLILGAVGFMLSASYGVFPIVASIYPARIRATGIGSGTGFGRVGAILSPLITGVVAAAGWSLEQMMLTLLVPAVIIAGLLVVSVARYAGSGEAAGEPPAA